MCVRMYIYNTRMYFFVFNLDFCVLLLLKIHSKKNHFSEAHIKSSESYKSYQMKLNLYLQNR